MPTSMSFIKDSSWAAQNQLSLNLLRFQVFTPLARENMPDNLINSDKINYMSGKEL